jgi:hypothetical protein
MSAIFALVASFETEHLPRKDGRVEFLMAPQRKLPNAEQTPAPEVELPIVCIVTVDEDFVDDLSRELAP